MPLKSSKHNRTTSSCLLAAAKPVELPPILEPLAFWQSMQWRSTRHTAQLQKQISQNQKMSFSSILESLLLLTEPSFKPTKQTNQNFWFFRPNLVGPSQLNGNLCNEFYTYKHYILCIILPFEKFPQSCSSWWEVMSPTMQPKHKDLAGKSGTCATSCIGSSADSSVSSSALGVLTHGAAASMLWLGSHTGHLAVLMKEQEQGQQEAHQELLHVAGSKCRPSCWRVQMHYGEWAAASLPQRMWHLWPRVVMHKLWEPEYESEDDNNCILFYFIALAAVTCSI